jgi:RNA polymerase sigma-70 factor, ECF subfamily
MSLPKFTKGNMRSLRSRADRAVPRHLDADRIGEHLDRLSRAALALTGSAHEAEDLVSDTIVRVLARPRRIHRDDDLGYLLRCLRNTWWDTLRTRRSRPVTAPLSYGIEHEDAAAGRRADAVAAAREVLAAVVGLPDRHRDAITLVDIAGFTYGEAAATLGVPPGTIMSRLARGRSAVAERLAIPSVRPRLS